MASSSFFARRLLLAALVSGVVTATATAAGASAGLPTAAAPDSHFENLGPQLTGRTLQAAAFTKDKDGADVVCVVVRSQPAAKLVVAEVATGAVRHTFVMPGANGAWAAVTASDGSVYVGTEDSAKLFRWIPGEADVRDLGRVLAGETFIWCLAAGDEGEVFGGTYPGGRVFRYAPRDGLSEPVKGAVVEGETYVRSIAFDRHARSVFAGVGVKTPHLIEIDLKTGAKREWLKEKYPTEQSIYGLSLSGNYIFGMMMPSHRTVVFDRRTGEQVNEVEIASLYELTSHPSPYDGTIYFVHDRKLKSLDPQHPRDPAKTLVSVSSSQANAWLKFGDGTAAESWLVVMTQQGELVRYHPPSGRRVALEVKVPEQPVILQSLTRAGDGRLWMGGYLSGGNAAFDPTTGKTEQYKGLSQAERLEPMGSILYFGLYPNGRVAEYDTRKPWDTAAENPRRIGTIKDQSRPVAMVAVAELGKLYVGMIPEYGLLGGAFSIWDTKARTWETFTDVVPRQAVASLTYAGGLVVGGTTIRGGLGVDPVEKEGKLFLWDPVANKKVFETVPVAGRGIVSGLTPMPDGTVWGFAQGMFFVFDMKTRRVVETQDLFHPDFSDRAMWQDANMVVHPSGDVYAVEDCRLLRIERQTHKVTVLREWVEKKHTRPIAMDAQGRIYFVQGTDLWRYTPWRGSK